MNLGLFTSCRGSRGRSPLAATSARREAAALSMKTLVAPMLLGSALAGGCAAPGGGDEFPENPWVVVDFPYGEHPYGEQVVVGYRSLAGDGETDLTESESVRLLHRKAQTECAKHGRWAGAASRGDWWPMSNPFPPYGPSTPDHFEFIAA